MKHPVRHVIVGALAIALVGTLFVIPPVRRPEAQPGFLQPQNAGTSFAEPSLVDPATLPVVSAAAQHQFREVPILSPDPVARQLAQEGRGPKGPDFDRSSIPGGAAPLPGPTPPAVNFAFNGISQTAFIPPDQALAAGPNHLVEQVNSTIQIYNKDGSTAAGPFSLQQWYIAPGSFVFDPVGVARKGSAVANDQLRFYEVALFLNTSTLDSRVMLAVSANNNGTSARCVYHFPGRFFNGTANDAFTDFPKLGVTHDPANLGASRILIGGNLFRFAGGFVQNTVFEINKQQVDQCVAAGFTRWTGFSDANDNSTGFTPVPATDYDDTAAFGWYVLLTRFGAGSGVTVWRNRFGVGFERFFVDTGDYTNPPAARQPGTATRIDTIDDRLQSAVTRYGISWVAHATALGGCGAGNDTSAVHIVAINTPKNAGAPSLRFDLVQLGPCSTDQYNGAVSQDSNGNPLWVYTESGTAENAHARINGFHNIVGFGAPRVLGAGPCACIETRGRWGDYSAAVLDPLDQRFVWVASEILLATNVWGTRIGRVIHSGSPI